jgi:cytoskeletal protein RodZ
MSLMIQPLCEKLRVARESRGLTLADVAHKTRIPVPRLIQLEEGNFAAFGNMAYARGFIKIYSRFLDVDAQELLADLPDPVSLGGRDDYRHLTESYGPWVDRRAPKLPEGLKPAKVASPAFTALLMTLVLGIGLAVYASVYIVPGLVRKAAADGHPTTSTTVSEAASAKPFTPGLQTAGTEPAPALAGAAQTTQYPRATLVEDAKPRHPLPQ